MTAEDIAARAEESERRFWREQLSQSSQASWLRKPGNWPVILLQGIRSAGQKQGFADAYIMHNLLIAHGLIHLLIGSNKQREAMAQQLQRDRHSRTEHQVPDCPRFQNRPVAENRRDWLGK
jgi:hypothetical protein